MVIRDQLIREIIDTLIKKGARVLLVGGAVRDYVMGKESKDIDLEIYGITLPILEKTLSQFGTVMAVGKSFGVLKIGGIDADFSLPRKDSQGRKPDVSIDPFMSYQEAFMRRDVTMNAMGIDMKDLSLIDPFNGQKDIHDKCLRAPNIQLFADDPLRLFRVMHFIGRFEMQPDKHLNTLCRTLDISKISTERIIAEIEKLFLYSRFPSKGLRWLKEIERLQECFPELHALIGVPQRSDFHPEGDVFEHSMQSLDAAASYTYETHEHKLPMLFAALCHDLGKVTTTMCVNGVYRSLGHAHAGIIPTKKILSRMTNRSLLKDKVVKLVEYHMEPLTFIAGNAKGAAYKRLAHALAPHATLNELALLNKADRQGRNGTSNTPLTDEIQDNKLFIKNAEMYGVLSKPEEAVIKAADIIHIIKPGPRMGHVLKKAYQLQIDKNIKDKELLIQLLKKE